MPPHPVLSVLNSTSAPQLVLGGTAALTSSWRSYLQQQRSPLESSLSATLQLCIHRPSSISPGKEACSSSAPAPSATSDAIAAIPLYKYVVRSVYTPLYHSRFCQRQTQGAEAKFVTRRRQLRRHFEPENSHGGLKNEQRRPRTTRVPANQILPLACSVLYHAIQLIWTPNPGSETLTQSTVILCLLY